MCPAPLLHVLHGQDAVVVQMIVRLFPVVLHTCASIDILPHFMFGMGQGVFLMTTLNLAPLVTDAIHASPALLACNIDSCCCNRQFCRPLHAYFSLLSSAVLEGEN